MISERQPEVEKVFITQAGQMQSELTFATDRVQLNQTESGFNIFADGELWLRDLIPELRGHYQRRNLPGVLASILQLRTSGFTIPDTAVRNGISNGATLTGLKGRWQKLRDEPLTICDTGHNPDGIKEVVDQLESIPLSMRSHPMPSQIATERCSLSTQNQVAF
mgnify:CR=1 FL=1